MSETGNNRIATLVIFLAVISIPIIISNRSIGLTVLFVSMLLYAAVYVRDRLQILGAERFAIGSILVWLGFVMTGFPVLAFAWDLFEFSTRIVLFVAGILLLILGFTTEYFNLNVAFLNFLKTTRARLLEAWSALRSRLFRSPYTITSFIFALLAITTLFIPNEWDLIFNALNRGYFVLIFSGISIISLGIEFRSLIFIMVTASIEFVVYLIRALFTRVRQFRGLIRTSGQLLYAMLKQLLTSVNQAVTFLWSNAYIISTLGFVTFAFLGIRDGDTVDITVSFLLLLMTLVFTLNQRQGQLADGLSRIQQGTYRRSFRLRRMLSRSASGLCPTCNTELEPKMRYCKNCTSFIPACMVCNMPIFAGEQILECPFCKVSGHASHVEAWMDIKAICPHCKESWVEIIGEK